MNIEKWPPVSTEIIESLKELFPLDAGVLSLTPHETAEWKGIYRVITLLELVNHDQHNPNPEYE